MASLGQNVLNLSPNERLLHVHATPFVFSIYFSIMSPILYEFALVQEQLGTMIMNQVFEGALKASTGMNPVI